ncbi:MAG TPA: cytochrome c [Marinagarivorans sp.]
MKYQALPKIARLSAGGLLAALIAACGSGGSDNDNSPSNPASSAAAESSSAAMMSSSEMASSSSAPAIAESCNVPDGTYIECLDFEAVSPGAIPTGFNMTGTGVTVVEGEGAHSGYSALKVTSTSAAPSFLTLNDFSGTHWGRLYYKNVAHVSPVPTWSHTTLVGAYDNATKTHFRLVDMVAAPDSETSLKDKYQHLYNIDNPDEIDLSLEGPHDLTYDDNWVCLEWSVSAVDQEYHVYLGGNEVALANRGTPTNSTDLQDAKKYDDTVHDFVPVPASFDEFKIGIQNYQGHAYTFLLDDIAIGDTRIGCDITEAAASSSSSAPAVVVGKADYDAMCVDCHNGTGSGPNLSQTTKTESELASIIDTSMPKDAPGNCVGQCADDVANYIVSELQN